MDVKKLNIEKKIFDISPYKPGESKKDTIKLSANENPLGFSGKIKKNSDILNDLNFYPDGGCTDLKQAIARNFDNISTSQIICGAGSDEIFNLLITAFTKPDDEIIYSEHGFLMYKIYASSHGVKAVAARETNLRANITEIINSVTDKTRIVFIANPNNPTGTYIAKAELENLRKALRDDILLVIDGAYAEYINEADYSSGVELVEKYDNVIATRTFSKIYGLAALRIGYGIMSESLIDILDRVRGPFNVSSIAQKSAIIALSDQEFIENSRRVNKEQQQYLERELDRLEIKYYKSYANFILIDMQTEQQANDLFNYLKNSGIIIRPLKAYNLPEKLRITIGKKEQNKKLINTIAEFKNHG